MKQAIPNKPHHDERFDNKGPITEEAINEAVKAGIYTIGADPVADQIWNGIEGKRKIAQRRNEILHAAMYLLAAKTEVSLDVLSRRGNDDYAKSAVRAAILLVSEVDKAAEQDFYKIDLGL